MMAISRPGKARVESGDHFAEVFPHLMNCGRFPTTEKTFTPLTLVRSADYVPSEIGWARSTKAAVHGSASADWRPAVRVTTRSLIFVRRQTRSAEAQYERLMRASVDCGPSE
jgi:hypothetical protein